MKIVYVSGPFIGDGTKKAIEKNIQTAKEYVSALANRRIGFFSPHLNNVELSDGDVTGSQRFFYEQDSEFLVRSDALLAIPGWEKSFGAKQEIKIAEALGLPIFYPKFPEDINDLEEWYYKADGPGKGAKKEIDWDKVIDIRRAMSKYTFSDSAA